MSRTFKVGQTVVTDPLLEGASGYLLTAVSPSVAAEDRSHLTELPQVSDYMHTEQIPGSFFSFHRLPSGAWALSQRFVHGIRRRSYNRVVVHTLVVSEDLLESVLTDAWLLVAVCRYRDPGTDWKAFTELAELVRDPAVRDLPDLPVQIPGDLEQARLRMLEKRCSFLKRHLGSEDALRNELAQILGAVEADCGVLLPQTPAMEQLLALAWSSLPSRDRLRYPWTTHLATSGGSIFRLALAPNPDDARYQQSRPERWLLRGEQALEIRGGGEALASVIAGSFSHFPSVEAGLTEHRLSLQQGDAVASLVQWILEGGRLTAAGFADARALGVFFQRHRLVGMESLRWPWLKAAGLLEPVVLTVVNQHGGGSSWDEAISAVTCELAERNLEPPLLDPAKISELIHRQGGRQETQVAMAALALYVASLQRRDADRSSLEEILVALQERGPIAQTAGFPAAAVFPALAESIVQHASEHAVAAYQVVQENGALGCAIDSFKPLPRYLTHLKAILKVARSSGDSVMAGRVAGRLLVPLLAEDPVQARGAKGLGKAVLEALRWEPEGLVRAFEEWKDGELYDQAAQTLKQWSTERLPGSLVVARHLASLTYNGREGLIRESRSILGISQALADAGAPTLDWLAFALAEASLIDSMQDPQELRSFREFLKRVPVDSAGLKPALRKFLARFHRVVSPATLGKAHSTLASTLKVPLGRYPRDVAQAFGQLEKLGQADLLLWGEALSAVTFEVAQHDAAVASQISCRWWRAMNVAARNENLFPAGALHLLDLLDRQAATSVLEKWAPILGSLGRGTRVEALFDCLEELARRHDLKNQELLCRAGRRAWELAHGEGDLIAAVHEIVRRANELQLDDREVARSLGPLFPASQVEAAQVIFRLLQDSRLHPGVRVQIQERLVARALGIVPSNSVQVIPTVDELVKVNNLLLVAVARGLGERWTQWFEEAMPFVRRLVQLKRFDSLDEFFKGVKAAGKGDFVRNVADRDSELVRSLRGAAKDSVGRIALGWVDELR